MEERLGGMGERSQEAASLEKQKRPASGTAAEARRFAVEMPGVEPGSEWKASPGFYVRVQRI